MRSTLLLLPVLFLGCLSAQPSDKQMPKAAVLGPAPLTIVLPPKTPMERIKELYVAEQAMKAKIFELAHGLTDERLAELNVWLSQFGVQITRTCTDPTHDHNKPDQKAAPANPQNRQSPQENGEVF